MNTDTIKQKIQELCPDVRSDSRGYQQIQLDREYQDYLDICKEVSKEDSSRTWASAGMAFERVKRLSNALAVFQDEPITLAVVLRAIHKGANPNGYFVDVYGGFWTTNPEKMTGFFWNLEHDNYDAQSQNTKDFIGSLFGV